jgi:hypothetical protein
MQAGAADPRPGVAVGPGPPSGPEPSRSRTAARVAWSLWGLTVGLLAGGVLLEALKDTGHPMLWEQSLALPRRT